MRGYEEIKQLAKEMGCHIPDLLVETHSNDPFYAGAPIPKAMAEWFAALWQRFGYGTGVYLRRVHYQLVGLADIAKHNGEIYENTENDWNYLKIAGNQARYLGLVDAQAFVDRKNPEPHIFVLPSYEGNSVHQVLGFPDWYWPMINSYLPSVNADLPTHLSWDMPYLSFEGYHYSDSLQPYHMEIWVEKGTMDDVLLPLCRRYSVNLVTGIGFLSITSVISLLRRIRQVDKPTRIFYISDFDPAGIVMPVSIARQVEYWLEHYGLKDRDVKLNPLVLTGEQCIRYKLPRKPIKDKDKRKRGFEERHGEGATELDALEALYPGEFARIVTEAIEQYRDDDLANEVKDTNSEWEGDLDDALEEVVESHQDDIADLKKKVGGITKTYNERLGELAREMNRDMAPYTERLAQLASEMDTELAPYKQRAEVVRQGIQNEMNAINVDPPDLPESELVDEGDGWLFDGSRDYLEQLKVYKAHQAGGQDGDGD